MERIRIGQIGIGHNHGGAKMHAVRKRPDLFEVIGWAEENEEWVRRRGGNDCYAGLPRLMPEEVLARSDAVLVECDVWDLTAWAQRCADAGKHIHLDKPASGTLEEFGRFLDTAEGKGLVVQMGYMYRYNPAVQRVFEAAQNGEFGEIYSINAEMSTFHAVPYKKWLGNFGGGIMYILGSHLVDLIVYLLGKPEKITSFFRRTGLDGVDFEDNDLAVLEYEKALARIFVSSVEVNGWGRRQLVVSGSRATADIVPLENECRMSWADTSFAVSPYKDQKRYVPVRDLPPDCRYDGMMADFHAYVTGEKKNPFSYAHDRLVQEVLDEIVGGVRFNGHDIGE